MSAIPCRVERLGLIDYDEAFALQAERVAARQQGQIPDTLLLCEHPHTYTLGTAADRGNLLLTPEQMAAQGITVRQIDRGGDVTYHGPGQIVGYPILQLARGETFRADVIGYVRRLEQVIIETISAFGITGYPIAGLTGVWVDTPRGEQKIAAIGVRVTVRAVTKHGFALNVNTDLSCFSGIIPCGIRDKGVTSLAALLGQPIDPGQAADALITAFGRVFGRDMQPANLTRDSA
jgi:lipoyl(octanoyl) transferase